MLVGYSRRLSRDSQRMCRNGVPHFFPPLFEPAHPAGACKVYTKAQYDDQRFGTKACTRPSLTGAHVPSRQFFFFFLPHGCNLPLVPIISALVRAHEHYMHTARQLLDACNCTWKSLGWGSGVRPLAGGAGGRGFCSSAEGVMKVCRTSALIGAGDGVICTYDHVGAR